MNLLDRGGGEGLRMGGSSSTFGGGREQCCRDTMLILLSCHALWRGQFGSERSKPLRKGGEPAFAGQSERIHFQKINCVMSDFQ